MKYRFAVELEFTKSEVPAERIGEILALAIDQGFTALGHERGITVDYYVEKLRARSIDPSKPVGEQE